MKIAIVHNFEPFLNGSAELLASNLKDQLQKHGHETLIVKIPFAWEPASKIIEHMLASRLLRLQTWFDRIIALQFPSYLVAHPNKVIWLLHHFRQAYDLCGEDIRIREMIQASDRKYLSQATKIYSSSETVADRLERFNGLKSEVLYPPLVDSEWDYVIKRLTHTDAEDYAEIPDAKTDLYSMHSLNFLERVSYREPIIQLMDKVSHELALQDVNPGMKIMERVEEEIRGLL